jgi:predicted  nucleic acid-binding Zn-ribbon protein
MKNQMKITQRLFLSFRQPTQTNGAALSLEEQLTAVNSENKTHKEKIADLELKLAAQNSGPALALIQSQLTEATTNLAKKDDEIKTLTASSAAATKEIGDFKTKITEAESKAIRRKRRH